ncbi:MAG: AraC family transcriptional regulator [Rikenellaceae bacterium]
MKDGFKGSRAIVVPQLILKEFEKCSFNSKLYITDIGYYPSASFHDINREHGVSQFVLIYCVNGNGWYEVNGHRYNVESDQCFVLPANTPHKYGASNSNPWTIYWLHFQGEFANFYGQMLKTPISLPPGNLSRIQERLRIFEDIYTALSKGYSKENMEFASSALYYFLGSIKYLETYRSVKITTNTDLNIIDNTILYMKENLEKHITLEDICEFAGYSESYFSTMFKNKTGHTPINYMIHLRMQTACQLLDFSDLKVNQICHKVGIDDPYYFSKLFTKVIGMSPSVYKAQKKG